MHLKRILAVVPPRALFLGLLTILFCWFYGQFAHRLYFAMDDYIESNVNLARPASAVIADCFAGRLNWSGYRPGTCALRVVASHLFTTDYVFMYFFINLACHFLNTLLVFRLAQVFFKRVEWSFLAGAIFLLLPSHNEAVFWYSGNSNLIALLFALLSLLAVLQANQQVHWRLWLIAWLTYGLAVLVYEVLLPLPLLLWITEWIINKKPLQRYQILLYGGFFIISCILLALRVGAMQGQLVVTSDSYAISLAPYHILHNYIILLGQVLFLHTSPWMHLPLYINIREWLSPWSGTALLSMFVAVLCSLIWLVYTWRQGGVDRRCPLLLWLLWGVLWLVLISLPFTLLAGRNPENRYVYIPSVGFSIALSALFAVLYRNAKTLALLRGLVLGFAVTLLSFYGYVDASDAHEWVQAGRHAKSFLTQTQALVTEFPKGSNIFQIGVPGSIGPAYVFTTEHAVASALRWFYHDQSLQVWLEKERLRDYLHSDQVNLAKSYLLFYDRVSYTTRLIDWVEDCPEKNACVRYPFATARPTEQADQQIDVSRDIQFVSGRISYLYPLDEWFPMPVLTTCWTLAAPPMLDEATVANLTLFVHFTDATGETTIEQADHKLQQSFPFTSRSLLTSQWPLHQPICDVTILNRDLFEKRDNAPITVRGGIWLPETGKYLTPATVPGYVIDQYGRIVFGELP